MIVYRIEAIRLRWPHLIGTLFIAWLGVATTVIASDVNVYSARKEALIKPLLQTFSAQTGINVNLITGKADALLQRLLVEGKASPADVFITVDAGRLHRAKAAGLLQPLNSPIINAVVPAHLRDIDDYWVGLSQRARPIIYAPERLDKTQLSTYEDLASKRWSGRLCLRSSRNIYNQSLTAAMLEVNGTAATEAWVRGMVTNLARPPVGGDIDQLKAVAAGVCDLTLANTYYLGRMINSMNANDQAVAAKLRVFWPNQEPGQRGAHSNVSGVGITRNARRIDNAQQLIEFLIAPESQAWYAQVNNEYPVVPTAKISNTLKEFGTFRVDLLPLNRLGESNRLAVELMDRAGWR
jgi:iron(III) transport system substrate-binding protein